MNIAKDSNRLDLEWQNLWDLRRAAATGMESALADVPGEQEVERRAIGLAQVAGRGEQLETSPDGGGWVEEFLERVLVRTGNAGGRIVRWITARGAHIPIREGQNPGQAIADHAKFELHATSEERSTRWLAGKDWHQAQAAGGAAGTGGRSASLAQAHERAMQAAAERGVARGRLTRLRPAQLRILYRNLLRVEGWYSKREHQKRTQLPETMRQRMKAIQNGGRFLAMLRKMKLIPKTGLRAGWKHEDGGEHLAEIHEWIKRVFKHTKPGSFGHVPAIVHDYILQDPGKVSEYIQRVLRLRRLLKMKIRIRGAHAHEGRGGLTVVQPNLGKRKGTKGGIVATMKEHDFIPVPDHPRVFYHPKSRMVAGDARPDNFRAVVGKEYPIDLQLTRATIKNKLRPFIEALLRRTPNSRRRLYEILRRWNGLPERTRAAFHRRASRPAGSWSAASELRRGLVARGSAESWQASFPR